MGSKNWQPRQAPKKPQNPLNPILRGLMRDVVAGYMPNLQVIYRIQTDLDVKVINFAEAEAMLRWCLKQNLTGETLHYWRNKKWGNSTLFCLQHIRREVRKDAWEKPFYAGDRK